MQTNLNSNTKTVTIGDDNPFVIIGKKINPTGIKKLGQALVDQDFEYVKHLARRQVAWGADVLDVNVGHLNLAEAALLMTTRLLEHAEVARRRHSRAQQLVRGGGHDLLLEPRRVGLVPVGVVRVAVDHEMHVHVPQSRQH